MANTNGSSIVVGSGERVPSWEELLGSNNWDGLLDPLDLTLRRFILRCGDFSECAYDAFIGDDGSPYYGNSRYGEKSFFKKVKLEFADDYDVSSLLYATFKHHPLKLFSREERKTHYIGYVAVSNDAATERLGRREIYVVWRGTVAPVEWEDDVNEPCLVPVTPLLRTAEHHAPEVMHGWLDIYTSSNPVSKFAGLSARDQLRTKINQLLQAYKDEKNKISVVVTGHSLGGALSVLSAFDLVENCVHSDIPVAAVVFACPRVGNTRFKERLNRYPNLKILHTRNVLDTIPKLPAGFGYRPVGVEIQIDGRKSPSFKKECFVWGSVHAHNLQGMLHVVAGWQGKERPFELAVKRSLALVNKSADLLNDDCKIPASWSAVENKDMVLNEDGEWVLTPPLQED